MKTRTIITLTSLMMMCLCFTATAAEASSDHGRGGFHGLITMMPGDRQQREILLERPVRIQDIGPVDTFVLFALGSEDESAGDLKITVKSKTNLDFGALMTFGIVGFGFNLDGTPLFLYETATTPFDVDTVAEINSRFGFMTIGVFVQRARPSRGVEFPAEFAVTFALSAQN